MNQKMIVNAMNPEEVRIAILDQNGVLEDFDIETRGVEKNKGNIYKGIVTAVEPALNAAFVNYGAEKEGFLTAGDVDPTSVGKEEGKSYRIGDLLKAKQTILVQVDREEVGAKGAVLTTYLSLAGRYMVLMPGAKRLGVSRRIEDDDERRKMREAADKLTVPDGMGVIIRTAGRDRTKTDLNRDLKVLLRMWDNIRKKASRAKAPALILKEQDVVIRALRDYFSSDVNEIVVDSDDAYDRAAEYMQLVMPKQRSALTRYVERRPIFHHYRIEKQLDALYATKVPLPSGGSIVIEPTEALVSIDVNSGKQKGARQEATAVKTNLDAAEEAARQLRLRDLGGIVVIDFIDMVSRRNKQQVEKTLKEALKRDKARVKVSRISANGTLEMTRQRLSSALRASVYRPCSVCHGSGHILNPESHALAVLRRLLDRATRGDLRAAKVRVESEAANNLLTEKWTAVQEIEQRYGVQIDIVADKTLSPGQDDFGFETDPNATVVPLPEPDFGPPELPEDLLEEADEEEAAQEAGEAKKKRKRRRRRRKKTGADAEETPAVAEGEPDDDGSGSTLALPSFELIDLEAYRRKQGGGKARRGRRSGGARGEHDEPEQQAKAEEGAGRKRRRRRGRRRGGDRAAAVGAPEAKPQQTALPSPPPPQPPPAAADSGVGGFFKKLFGIKPKT